MNQGLTKREKVLIIIAVSILVIFVGFKFVFVPTYNKYSDATEKNAQLTTDKMLMELKLDSEEIIKTGFENTQSRYEASKKFFPAIMTNEELDRLITGLCLDNNIKPTLLGMSIIQRESEIVSSEVVSSETDSSEVTSSGTTSGDEIVEAEPPISVFSIATATINASGTYEDLQNVIDWVNATTYIRINSLKYVNTKATAGEEKPPEITIIFEVTMVDEDKLK